MLIIVLCIGMMALDMQVMLNPLERITKLIKLLTGKKWKKRMKELRNNAGDHGMKLTPAQVMEEVEMEVYFGLRMIDMFFMDVEEAFSISMGKYRQRLWGAELWFDKMFLFVNRIILQATTQELTVDQLWAQLKAHFDEVLPPKLAKKLKKKGGATLQAAFGFWAMLERPRMWLADSAKLMLLKDMRALLGATPSVAAGQIALIDLKHYFTAKVGSVYQAELAKLGKPPPPTKKIKRAGLFTVATRLRQLVGAIVLSKLSVHGVRLVVAPPGAAPDAKRAAPDAMLRSLRSRRRSARARRRRRRRQARAWVEAVERRCAPTTATSSTATASSPTPVALRRGARQARRARAHRGPQGRRGRRPRDGREAVRARRGADHRSCAGSRRSPIGSGPAAGAPSSPAGGGAPPRRRPPPRRDAAATPARLRRALAQRGRELLPPRSPAPRRSSPPPPPPRRPRPSRRRRTARRRTAAAAAAAAPRRHASRTCSASSRRSSRCTRSSPRSPRRRRRRRRSSGWATPTSRRSSAAGTTRTRSARR